MCLAGEAKSTNFTVLISSVKRQAYTIVPLIKLQSGNIREDKYFTISVHVHLSTRGRRGRNCMVVGFTTTCAIKAYHH
jgi:hypothetical protein